MSAVQTQELVLDEEKDAGTLRWSELIGRVSDATGTEGEVTRRVLNALVQVSLDALEDGEEVPLRGLCILSSRWREPRALRSVSSQRRVLLGGRYVPRMRPSRTLRRRLAQRTPQRWRDPEMQTAWRLAETLVDDLDLYNGMNAPRLDRDQEDAAVLAACREAFGGLWSRVEAAFRKDAPASQAEETRFLVMAARRTWTR